MVTAWDTEASSFLNASETRRCRSRGFWMLLAAIAVLIASLVVLSIPFYRRNQLLLRIERANGRVRSEKLAPPSAWYRHLFGEDSLRFLDSPTSIFVRPMTLTDRDLADLAAFGRLNELSLASVTITDDGLANLAGLDQLRTLSLGPVENSQIGLAPLGELKNLRALNFWSTHVSAADLAHLRKLPELRYLSFHEVSVSDEFLAELSQLTHVTKLYIHDAGSISDDDLVHFQRMTGLTRLHLGDCRATPEGIETLRRALPGCHVSWSRKHEP